MWRRFSLLVLWCAVSGLDALEANRTEAPALEKMLLTEAAQLVKPGKDAPPTVKLEESTRGTVQQTPDRGASGGKIQQQPTTEPLQDELDNQENIMSQVRIYISFDTRLHFRLCDLMIKRITAKLQCTRRKFSHFFSIKK